MSLINCYKKWLNLGGANLPVTVGILYVFVFRSLLLCLDLELFHKKMKNSKACSLNHDARDSMVKLQVHLKIK